MAGGGFRDFSDRGGSEPGNVGNSVGGLWLAYGGYLPLGGFGREGYGVCLAGSAVGRIWPFCGCSGE